MRNLWIVVLLAILLPIQVQAKILGKVSNVGRFGGLEIYDFQITGRSFEVGSTVTVSYHAKNVSSHPVRFGKYGAFIACRDPNYNNRDFGHNYRNATIYPGYNITVSGKIKINKKGTWEFWPGLYLAKLQWGPSGWHAIYLTAKRRHRYNPSKITIKPPFMTCTLWKVSPGSIIHGSKAQSWCNTNTGYIGILDSSFAGGAASEGIQYFSFRSPKSGRARVEAIFYYVGGAKTDGIASFAGLQAVYKFKRHYVRTDIEPGLNYQIAADKIKDIALMAAGASGEESVDEALEDIDTINDLMTLSSELIDLYNVGKAKRFVYRFNINVRKGDNILGVGMRGNCSAVVTGSSFVIVAGQLKKVIIHFR